VSKPHSISRLTLAYDGSPFAGWAVQPGERTVEGELRAALGTVLRAPVALIVAGRTDRGVHALGQVVSYEGELPRLRSVNALLPPEIAVLEAERAPDGFSARHDARSRSYRYRILARSAPSPFERGRALWHPYPFDEAVLHDEKQPAQRSQLRRPVHHAHSWIRADRPDSECGDRKVAKTIEAVCGSYPDIAFAILKGHCSVFA